MNHISSKWLRRLRWLLLLYSLALTCGYLYLGLAHHEWHGTKTFPITVVYMLAVQLVYEVFASFKLMKNHAYVATTVTAYVVAFESAVLFNPNGVYFSPYALAFVLLTFIMGALGWFAPLVLLTTMLMFSLFGFSGFIQSPVPIDLRFVIMAIFILGGCTLNTILGYLFWSPFYDLSENTDLRRLNTRLKRGAQQSTTILNSIGDGVIVFDAQGAIDLINPPASAMMGIEPKEVLGQDIRKILQYSDPDPNNSDVAMPDLVGESLKGKKHINQNVKLDSTKVQGTIIISLSLSPIVIPPDNDLVGGVAIMHDITAEQEIEKQRSDFISTASHEMRTPLATIEGYLDLALTDKNHPPEEPVRSYIKSAHESTEHLGKLFQDLLSSSRAEDGSLTNNPQVIELTEFLEQFREDFSYSTSKYGLDFEFSVGTTEVQGKYDSGRRLVKPKYYVYADPDRLRELVNNLFDNAIKFTQKGKIAIGIGGDHNNVQLSIRDSGIGVPKEDIQHLFQKFYRVDNTPTRTIGGTGLGLFICRKITEMYGGRIWVESTLGEGSTFYVSLPRLSDQEVRKLRTYKPPSKMGAAVVKIAKEANVGSKLSKAMPKQS